MSSLHSGTETCTETSETGGCRVALRRVEGPEAAELFLHARPLDVDADAGRQTDAIFRALVGGLAAEGGSYASVVSETIFLRDLRANLEPVRTSRRRALAACGAPFHRPAISEVEQPPLDEGACLEVSVQALLPKGAPLRLDAIGARPRCGCAECARSHGLVARMGDEARLYAGGLYGPGEGAYEQALAMFTIAEDLLQQAGMAFRDVVRTWIHLRDIDRDYDALNRARRAFFEARGIDPPPASTGIGGGPAAEAHDLCLGIHAVRAPRPLLRTMMTAPTLNEATSYGADFVRGMKLVEQNKVALHVSGTASIDEAGRTAHGEDFGAQADRMLVNIAALLEGQDASFDDVVSAVTYLRHPADAARLREKLREAGFQGFPHVLVKAPICRPDLLCETEALAALPRADRGRSSGE